MPQFVQVSNHSIRLWQRSTFNLESFCFVFSGLSGIISYHITLKRRATKYFQIKTFVEVSILEHWQLIFHLERVFFFSLSFFLFARNSCTTENFSHFYGFYWVIFFFVCSCKSFSLSLMNLLKYHFGIINSNEKEIATFQLYN